MREDAREGGGSAHGRVEPEGRSRDRVGPDFYRAHGLGNDYLVFEAALPTDASAWDLTDEAIQAICHRLTGVGSDGIVVLMDPDPGPGRPFPLRMFNPDGSEFERSGNGLRILAAHLRRTGKVRDAPFTVRSGGSLIRMVVHGVTDRGLFDVSVEMGRARTDARAVEFEAKDPREADPDAKKAEGAEIAGAERGAGRPRGAGKPRRAGASAAGDATPCTLSHPERGPVTFQPVSVGNPHAVVFGSDLSREALHSLGPFLCEHPAFASGTNVQLARIAAPGRLEIAIWERGVGPTTASGTSSCAAAVAAVHQGRLDPGRIQVLMEGGTLEVEVSRELDVTLRGPVQEVARGRLLPGFVAQMPG